jgi:hypothetical protein
MRVNTRERTKSELRMKGVEEEIKFEEVVEERK